MTIDFTDSRRLRGIANRGFSHVFLKSAVAETCDATTVETGNVFSPGAWTCGISVVWQDEDGWKSVEDLPLEAIQWRFEDGEPGGIEPGGIEPGGIEPVLRAVWGCGSANFTHRLTHLGGEGAAGVDYARIEVSGESISHIGILVRDIGPAGGKISALTWNQERHLEIGQGPRLSVERAPDAVHIWPADRHFDAPAALLVWRLNLTAINPIPLNPTAINPTAARFELALRVEHGFGDRALGNLAAPPPHGPQSIDAGFARAVAE